VPAIELVDQTIRAFWNEGIRDIGVIQSDHPETDGSRPVQVASIQTLMRRKPPRGDVVVIDEAHRWFKFYGDWMRKPDWTAVPFIGLSATPWTRGLGQHYDDLIVAATTRELIDADYLSDFKVLAPTHPDLTGVRTVAGDYHEGQLAEAMNRPHITGEVVRTWLEKGENRSTLCFAVDRAHGKELQRQFEAAGVSAGYIDGETLPPDRKRIREQFHDGSARVVVNVMCLTAGVDWDVRCIILARPTKSEMLYVQIIGRGLRTAEGKDHCLILDHSDTTLRLGFVTDIHHERLDDGKRRPAAKRAMREEPLPKECLSCSFLKPARIRECPNCGFAPERQSDVLVENGELSEIENATLSAVRNADRHEKQRWYSGLLFVARQRGYQPGWVSHTYKQKFGRLAAEHDRGRRPSRPGCRELRQVPDDPPRQVAGESSMRTPLSQRAQGRWRGILPCLGVDSRFLTGKHMACPICRDGKDRFRFDDKDGKGTWICSHCGAGDGVKLVMEALGLDFRAAAERIEQFVGNAEFQPIKTGRSAEEKREALRRMWSASRPVDIADPVGRYLQQRVGLETFPPCLRYVERAKYQDDVSSWHPAMIARCARPMGCRSACIGHSSRRTGTRHRLRNLSA
jgi:superfamily II DNA or RNA helicase